MMTASPGPDMVVAVPAAPPAVAAGANDPLVIRKRDKVILEVSVGAAHVERQAIALQNARAGQMLFVRVEDGEVIAARAEQAP